MCTLNHTVVFVGFTNTVSEGTSLELCVQLDKVATVNITLDIEPADDTATLGQGDIAQCMCTHKM